MIGPSKVTHLHASLKSDNSILVTCQQPVNFNGPDDGKYLLEVKPGGSDIEIEKIESCKFLVKHLQYSTKYDFVVRLYFL